MCVEGYLGCTNRLLCAWQVPSPLDCLFRPIKFSLFFVYVLLASHCTYGLLLTLLRDHFRWCPKLNLAQLSTRQVPYLLYCPCVSSGSTSHGKDTHRANVQQSFFYHFSLPAAMGGERGLREITF